MDHLPFTQPNAWPEETGKILLPIARKSIENTLKGIQHTVDADLPSWVQHEGACFVTLTQSDALRGCIGSLMPHRSLLHDVQENAIAAAFHDPRFKPLRLEECADTRIELSVLSPITAFNQADIMTEADAITQLRPHVDGIVLTWRHHRSTFLPQVWEQLPDPTIFLAHLKQKAGLKADFWTPDLQLSRYTVAKWHE